MKAENTYDLTGSVGQESERLLRAFLAQRPSRDLTINTPAMAAATSGVRTQDHTRSWATGGKLSSPAQGVCTGTGFPSKWSNEEGAAHCLSPPSPLHTLIPFLCPLPGPRSSSQRRRG